MLTLNINSNKVKYYYWKKITFYLLKLNLLDV